jgi:hypothetical protein
MRNLAKLAVISAAGAAGVCLALPALAATSTWEHNGSRVTLEENGTKRTLTFANPSAALEKAGVKSGAVLFDGQVKKDGRVSGYAKIFKAGCDPVDYFVEGTIDGAKGEMVLQGQAPVYSGKDCKIKGYSEDNKDSMLVFRSSGGRTYAGTQPEEQGDGGYDARGERDPRNGEDEDGRRSATARRPAGQPDDGYDDRRNDSARQDDRQYDDRRYDGEDPDARDYARRDYDPRYDRPRNADPYYDDDEEYTNYRYRTYRRTYERPYQPWWRYGR